MKTAGMSGASTDGIDDVIDSLNFLYVSIHASKKTMTTFLGARCRGKTNVGDGNTVAAALACIATEVLGLPGASDATDMSQCGLEPRGETSAALLRSKTVQVENLTVIRFAVFLLSEMHERANRLWATRCHVPPRSRYQEVLQAG